MHQGHFFQVATLVRLNVDSAVRQTTGQ
jgi:hypothetical protein